MLGFSRRWGLFLVVVVGCSKGGGNPAAGGYGGEFLGGFLNHDGAAPGAGGASAGGTGGTTTPPDPPLELPKYAGRIVITPAAALFTKVGDTATLRAEAFDASGQKIAATFTWESARPDMVAVDASGQVTAMKDLGSTQIRARAGGLVSAPALVLVAEPAPGAVLVSDAQVTAGPTLVDPAAAQDVGTKLKLSLTGVTELAPGTVLLAREGKPVGGRVVSATAAGGQLEVVLEIIPLLDLFKRLDAQGTHAIDGAAVAELIAVPPKLTMAQQPPPGEIGPIRQAQSEPGRFRLGPFDCDAKLGGSAITGTASLRLVPEMSFDYRFVRAADGTWSEMMAKLEGKLTATATVMLSFAPMLVGTATCDVTLYEVPVPLGGPLGMLAGFRVPLGIGGDFTAVLAGIPLSAGLELKGETKVKLGFQYTPQAGTTSLNDIDSKFQLTPKYSVPDSELPVTINTGLSVGGLTGINVGLPFIRTLKLVKGSAMVKAQAKLGHWKYTQLGGFAAAYDIKPVIEAGAGKDVAAALRWFGGAIALKPALSLELPVLAESPRGTLTADKLEAMPGMPVKLTINLKPDSVKFLGLDNAKEVRIWQAAPGMEPKLVETIPASAGQSTFNWTWNTTITDLGSHLFWAGTMSTLAPGLLLKVSEAPPLMIHVGQRKRWKGTATCSQMGTQTVTEGGVTTTYARTNTVSVQVEHATDADAVAGTLTITKVDAKQTYSVTSDSTGGSMMCPSMIHVDFGESAMLNTVLPGSLATLLVREDTGQYLMGAMFPEVQGEAHHKITTTVSGDPMLCGMGSKTEDIPREFRGSFSCGASGMFMPGGDTISGTETITQDAKPPITATNTWMFQRL